MSDDTNGSEINEVPNTGIPDPARLVAWVHGHVQGVGFRWSTRVKAKQLDLVGYAKNYPDGRVLVVAEGSQDACEKLLVWLNGHETPGVVDTVVHHWMNPRGEYRDFGRE